MAKALATDIQDDEVAAALAQFDDVWAVVAPREQARVLTLLIERVEFDGERGNIEIVFHPSGLKLLTTETTSEETAA